MRIYKFPLHFHSRFFPALKGIFHDIGFGEAYRGNSGLIIGSFVFVVKTGYQKIPGNRISGFLGGQTDAYSCIVVDTDKRHLEAGFSL